MAVKLAARVTFDKRGKSHAHIHTHTLKTNRRRAEPRLSGTSLRYLSPEPTDTADWSLCDNYSCFCASDQFNITVPVLLSVCVYPRGGVLEETGF